MNKQLAFIVIIAFAVVINLSFTHISDAKFRMKQFETGETLPLESVVGIKALSILYIGNESLYDGDEYPVTSFEMLTVSKEDVSAAYIVPGNTLPEEAKSSVQSGTKVFFQKIRFKSHDGVLQELESTWFFVK